LREEFLLSVPAGFSFCYGGNKMTEKQYEDLMYALCTLIALEKSLNKPQPVLGIPYNVVVQQEQKKLKDDTDELYKDLTGSTSNRGNA
jgi:hypothetical protein